MLATIDKRLTGDMLKALCDMGHGDTLVLADANFPGEALSRYTSFGKLIRCPGMDVTDVYQAIHELFPLDSYSQRPAMVMDLTDSDKEKGMKRPEAWADYERILTGDYPEQKLGLVERFEFYEMSKKAYVIIQTGEERQYGNLLLVKGCVL